MTEATTLALVDSHCHIDMPQFDADRDEVVARAREAGLVEMLIVGGVDEAGGHRRALRWPRRSAFRLPPVSTPTRRGSRPTRSTTSCAAWPARGGSSPSARSASTSTTTTRRARCSGRCSAAQIRLAREVGLPIVVHTREADAETAAILEQEGAAEAGGVIHCFTGGLELARRALDLGLPHLLLGDRRLPEGRGDPAGGPGGARRPPPGRDGRPLPGPAAAPGKRNEPAFVVDVARKVAALRGDARGGARCPRAGQLRAAVPARRLTRLHV